MSETIDQDDITRPERDDVTGGLRLADALLRVGDRTRAVEAYAGVADRFLARGDVIQAMAVCYRALQLDAARFVSVVGESMLKRLGPEATPLLERASHDYERDGDFDAAVTVTRKLVDRDPNCTELRLRLAEQLVRAGRKQEAIDFLWSMVQALDRDGNNAELIEVGALLLDIKPDHVPARRLLARSYLRVGDLGDCLYVVRPLVQEGKDPVALEVFARLQIELGRNDGAFEVLRCLAAVRAAAGEQHLADDVLARASRWAFDDDDFRGRVAELRERLASSADLGPVQRDLAGLDAEVVELDIEMTG